MIITSDKKILKKKVTGKLSEENLIRVRMTSNKKKAKKMSPLRKIYDTFSSSSSDESSSEDSVDLHQYTQSNRHHHHHYLFDFLVGPGSSYGGIYLVPNTSRKMTVH